MREPVLEIRGLSVNYGHGPRAFHAVRDVSLTLKRGETLGIVGESGCGKTSLAKAVMGLEKPSSGEIILNGQRIDILQGKARRAVSKKLQMVFQDSGASLDSRKTILQSLTQPMLYHGLCKKAEAPEQAAALLEMVSLPASMMERYPHELSGGQRQRVCIARALSLKPEVLVLDEPVSALDVSVQAQILELLRSLQEKLSLTCLLIGHGLPAVRYLSSHIAVMYRGEIVEEGPSDLVFGDPAHPYTRALVDASPSADYARRDRPRLMLRGEAGESRRDGCPLYARCPWADESCSGKEHPLTEMQDGRKTRCSKAKEAEL